MSNGTLTGMIKQNYKNMLLTRQSDCFELFVLKEMVDSI